jgi:hypothetical protein
MKGCSKRRETRRGAVVVRAGKGIMTNDEQTVETHNDESKHLPDFNDGQRAVVFACFWAAAHGAQTFEVALRRFLTAYNKKFSDCATLEEFGSNQTKLRKRTMGQLVERVKKVMDIAEPVITQHFDDAVESRNFLMHHFFIERGGDLDSEDGRIRLINDLISIQNQMRRAEIVIDAIWRGMVGTTTPEPNTLTSE